MSRRLAAIMAILMLMVGCGAPESVSEITIDLSEYRIDTSHTVLAAGDLTLQLDNGGDLSHTIVISTPDGDVIDASEVLLSGESTKMVVALEPGDYVFTCRIVADLGGQLLDHYELGMVETFTVTG